jgi:hypothetical protein
MEQLFIFISFKDFFKSWNVIVIGIFVLKSRLFLKECGFGYFLKYFLFRNIFK